MADILDEVEGDYRAERTAALLRRWGGVLAGALLLVLAGVGAWQGWQWWQARQAGAAATEYLAVHRATEAEGADLKAAADRFAALADGPAAGYRTLARLRAAALLAETGDRDGARALWDRVAREAADPIYRDLGALLWALHGLDLEAPDALAARLEPLAREGGTWRASARELLAVVALRRGDAPAAREALARLAADVAAPPGVRERARRLAAGIAG